MEPDDRNTLQERHPSAPIAQPRIEAPVDPFWAIGVGLAVLFAVGAAALAAG